MAQIKRTARAKHLKVYDPTGKEYVMPVLNARDVMQHLGWTQNPPVVVYRDTPAAPAAPAVAVHDTSSWPSEAGPAAETAITFKEPVTAPVESVELLNDPDGADDVGEEDDAEFVPMEVPANDGAPSTVDPSTWTKEAILSYAEEHYSTKLDGRKAQMNLAAELSKLIETLG